MRSRLLTGAGVLLLVSRVGFAQTPAKPQPQAPARPGRRCRRWARLISGSVAPTPTSMTARYERYRDLRNGATSLFQFGKETESYFADARAFNVGLSRPAIQGRLPAEQAWISGSSGIPSRPTTASSPCHPGRWVTTGVLTISHGVRQQVQNRTAVGVPCAPGAPPATCNNPTQRGRRSHQPLDLQPTDLSEFDIRSRRDTAAFGLSVCGNAERRRQREVRDDRQDRPSALGCLVCLQQRQRGAAADRQSNQRHRRPGSNGPIRRGWFRLAWDGSFFSNNVDTLVWDNPIRATDFNNGTACRPTEPYDPSGYSNGNGPAQGRMALWPGNSMSVRERHGPLQDAASAHRSTARCNSPISRRTRS